jgi:hypothetical protein
MADPENPFIFGEIIEEPNFVDRTSELHQLVRDLADGQKVFLLRGASERVLWWLWRC